MDNERAVRFAADWISAWNERDLDKVLAAYRPDVELRSNAIIRFQENPDGVLQGREAIRSFWARILKRLPDLRFELVHTFVGAGSVVVAFKTSSGREGAEYFCFDDDGKVFQTAAHYVPEN